MKSIMERQAWWKERRGYLYVIACPGFVKIGRTSRVEERLLEVQVGNPWELTVLLEVRGNCVDETEAHHKWAHLRVRGEWYRHVPELDAWMAQMRDADRVERAIQDRITAWLRKRQAAHRPLRRLIIEERKAADPVYADRLDRQLEVLKYLNWKNKNGY